MDRLFVSVQWLEMAGRYIFNCNDYIDTDLDVDVYRNETNDGTIPLLGSIARSIIYTERF